ncbi:MAG: S8 family serine peptidase [Candidatus Gracilibacteria bacterium]|nr:S8 family serine peptidase [Candidatus Gracilibacteria bacterium]
MIPFSFFRRFVAVSLIVLLSFQQVALVYAQEIGDVVSDENIEDVEEIEIVEEIEVEEDLVIDSELIQTLGEDPNDESTKLKAQNPKENVVSDLSGLEDGEGQDQDVSELTNEEEPLDDQSEAEISDVEIAEEEVIVEDEEPVIDAVVEELSEPVFNDESVENDNNVQNGAFKKGVKDRVKRSNGTQDKSIEAQYGYVPPKKIDPVIAQKEKLQKVYEEIREMQNRGEEIRESDIRSSLSAETLSADFVVEFMKSFVKKATVKDKPMRVQKGIIPAYLLQPRLGGGFTAQGLNSSGTQRNTQQAVEYVAERILVRSFRFLSDEEMNQIGDQTDTVLRRLQSDPFHLYRIDAKSGQTTVELLQAFHGMQITQYVEPDYVYTAKALPNDPLYSARQWQHNNVGGAYGGFSTSTAGIDLQSQDAWDISTGTGNTILAVVDTGVQLDHDDLKNRLWDGSGGCVDQNGVAIAGGCPHNGFDFFDSTVINTGAGVDSNPHEEGNHGTFVAGMAVAQGNNGVGIAGVNWNGRVMALKVAGPQTLDISASAAINSIYFAVRNGAQVINLSFGGNGFSQPLADAIGFAKNNGVLVVAAAGNESQDLDAVDVFPCEVDHDNVICVAALNPLGGISFNPPDFNVLPLDLNAAPNSNFGAVAVDVAAPGTFVYSTSPITPQVYGNTFDAGVLTDFSFSAAPGAPASDWGYGDDGSGSNTVLKTHVSGNYQDNEQSFATLNQNIDLSAFAAGHLQFTLDCTAASSGIDGALNPLDGVSLELSIDGGQNFEEIYKLNSLLAPLVAGSTASGGIPIITYGFKDRHFVSQLKIRFGFFSNADAVIGGGCTIDNPFVFVKSGSNYTSSIGTSFASPAVAGLATLIWDFKPTLTMLEVKQAIFDSVEVTTDLTGKVATNGYVNSYRSLALLADPVVTNIEGFKTQGGDQFSEGDTVSSTDPHFTWTAPVGQGIISGYSFAVDAAPDANIDTTDLFTTLSGLSDGLHVFSVSGISDVGVLGTQQDFSFTVDTQAPNTPTGLSVNNATNQVNDANKDDSSLVVMVAEAGMATYTFSDGNNPDVTASVAVSIGLNTLSPIDVSSLDDGAISVSVTNSDAAGNTSSAVQVVIQKDTFVVTPTAVELNGGIVINNAAKTSVPLTFSVLETGTADYVISIGGTNLSGSHTITNPGAQTKTLDVSSLGEGALSISVTLTDDFGNVSGTGAGNVEKDTEVDAPMVVLLNSGNPITASNQSTVNIGYTVSEAGNAAYEITDGVTTPVSGNLAAAGAGAQAASGLDVTNLNEGTVTLNVIFTDSAGNVSATSFDTEMKDTEVNAPFGIQLNAGVTITQATAGSVALTFTADEMGEVAYVISNGVGNVSASHTVTIPGAQTVSGIDVSSLADGTLSLSLTNTDLVGNISSAGLGDVQKDAIANAPTAVRLNNDLPITAANQNAVSLTFIADERGDVAYVISAGASQVTGNQAVSGAGAQTIANIDLTSLNEGAIAVSVILTDTVGNASATGNAVNTKDTEANVPTSPLLNGGVVVNAASENSVNLTFTADETGVVAYLISNSATNVSGNHTVTTPGVQTVASIDVSGLDEGTLTSSVTLTDTVGNTSLSAQSQVEKDTEVNAPTNPLLNGGVVINALAQGSVSLTFGADETGTVAYVISDGASNVSGNHNVTTPGVQTVNALDMGGLADVNLTISVTLTDAAGNLSTTTQSILLKDAMVNNPTALQLNAGMTVNNAMQNSVELTFDADETGVVAYVISNTGGNVSGNHTVTTPGAQNVSNLDVSGLDEGTMNLSVQLTDDAGNTSQMVIGDEQKDTVANDVTALNLNGGVTINKGVETSVALTFSADESGEVSYVISDGVGNVSGSHTVTTPGAQTVSNLDVSGLNNGNLTFSVTLTDTAGNAANTVTGNIEKDAQVSDPTVFQLNGGIPINGATANSVDLTFKVLEPGTASYTILDSVGNVSGSQMVTSAGAQTISGIDVSGLLDENLTVRLDFTDESGNVANQIELMIQKDVVVNSPSLGQLNGGVVVNAATQGSVDLTFFADELGVVAYVVSNAGGNVSGNHIVTLPGTQTVNALDVSGLGEGAVNIALTLTDSVGNSSGTAAFAAQKDSEVVVPTSVQLNGGVTINQGAEADVSLTFAVGEPGIAAYVISDGVTQVSGSHTVTGAGPQTVNNLDVSGLDDGNLTLSVTMTDDAGNTSTAGLGTVQKDAISNAPTGLQLNGGVTISTATAGSVDLTFVLDEAGMVNYSVSDGVTQVTGNESFGAAGLQTIAGLVVTGLNDGNLVISATVTDTAGNQSMAANASVLKDTQVNAPTTVVFNGAQIVNAAGVNDVDVSFSVDETGTAAYVITDDQGAKVQNTVVVGSTGQFTIMGIDVSALDDGVLVIDVSLTDEVGNVSTIASITGGKDVLGVTPTNVQLNSGVVINQAAVNSVDLTFDVIETGVANYSISDGVTTLQDTVVVSVAGSQTVSGIDVSSFQDVLVNISVTLTDGVGNVSLAATGTVQKDAIVNSVQNVQLNGSVLINAVAQGDVSLSFTADEAGTVSYVISNGGANVSGNHTVSVAGVQTVSNLDVSGLGEGTLSVAVGFTDTAGNTAADALGTVQKDSEVSPAANVQLNAGVPINAALAGNVSLSFDVSETGNADYVISDGATQVSGNHIVTNIGAQTVSNLDVSALSEGTLNISVTFTDTAGNAAATAAGNELKDTQALAATNVQLNGGAIINVATGPTVDLTFSVAEAGSGTYVISNGSTQVNGVFTAAGAGIQTVSDVNISSLDDGTLNIEVDFSDTIGNTAPQAIGNVQKDAQNPDAPTNVLVNNGLTLSALTVSDFAFTGTVSEMGVLSFSFTDGVNTPVLGNQAVSAGAFTVLSQDISSLNEGNITLTVSMADQAGNGSADAIVVVIKDTEVNDVTNIVVNNGNPLGSASVGSVGVAFDVDETGSVSVSVTDGTDTVNGNVTVTTPGNQVLNGVDVSGLKDGNLTFSLQLTDTIGNVGNVVQQMQLKDTVLNEPTALVLNSGAVLNSTQQAKTSLTFNVDDLGTFTYEFLDTASGSVSGAFSVTTIGSQMISGLDLSSLQDGALSVNYTFVDSFGNTSANLPKTVALIVKDTIVTIVRSGILNDGRLIVNTTSNAVEMVFSVIETGNITYSIADQNSGVVNGNFAVTNASFRSLSGDITIPAIDLSSLQDDVLDVSMVFTDTAGNNTPSVVTRALKGPGTPTIVALINDLSTFKTAGGAGSLNFTALTQGTGVFRLSDQLGTFVSDVFRVTQPGAQTLSGVDISGLDTTQDVNVALGFVTDSGESDQSFDVTVTPNREPVTSGGGNVARGRFGGSSVGGSSTRKIVDMNVGTREQDLEEESTQSKTQNSKNEDLKDRDDKEDPKGEVSPFKEPGVREMDEERPFWQQFFDFFSDEGSVMIAADMQKEDFAAVEVAYLRDLGIVKGMDGTDDFAGDQVIDRAQALKIALQLTGNDLDIQVENKPFSDVDVAAWYAPIIRVAKQLGYVQGYDDGSFVPWQAVNRAEGLKMAYQILGIEVDEVVSTFADVDTGIWYSKYMEDAVYKGLIAVDETEAGMFVNPTDEMTRAEFVYLIVQLSQEEGSVLAMQ